MSDNISDEKETPEKKMTAVIYVLHLLKKYWWVYVLWWILKLTFLGGITKWFLETTGW